VYKLPDQIGRQVTEQYARDVARVHGGPVVNEDAEYRKFMVDLGGAPPPELMGLDREGELCLGMQQHHHNHHQDRHRYCCVVLAGPLHINHWLL
jgi:hypothetical protein